MSDREFGTPNWPQMKRNCRDDGCCCIFDEDGETQLEWCSIHAAMRDRIRELEEQLENADE